jgi:TetR/AcrR family transcriptional regulator of autoinduction and epiphytic fitness
VAQVRVDGRTARAQRTRRAMVDALLALIAEGDLMASPERIVERAGVSLRTLWTNFKDLEGLYAAANLRLIEIQRETYEPIAATGPLSQRIRAFCEQRGRLLEMAAPAQRASQLRLPYSAQLRRNRAVHYRRMTDEVDAVFPDELALSSLEERDQLVRALAVNTGSAAWTMLRDELGLSQPDATEVMIRSVSALLCPAPPDSEPEHSEVDA